MWIVTRITAHIVSLMSTVIYRNFELALLESFSFVKALVRKLPMRLSKFNASYHLLSIQDFIVMHDLMALNHIAEFKTQPFVTIFSNFVKVIN